MNVLYFLSPTILYYKFVFFFFFQAEDGIRDKLVTGVQTCALPISWSELPIPTPPPWWNDTHPAPEAVFNSALRMAQSAIASEPSCIASVSRNGEDRKSVV